MANFSFLILLRGGLTNIWGPKVGICSVIRLILLINDHNFHYYPFILYHNLLILNESNINDFMQPFDCFDSTLYYAIISSSSEMKHSSTF